MAVSALVLAAVVHLVLYDLGYHRGGDDLAVRMRDTGARRGTEVSEYQQALEARTRGVRLGHALLVDGKQLGQMRAAHLMQGDAVILVADHLLQAEGNIGVAAVIAEHRV